MLFELACGSTWAANYVAREDGRREAKLLETRLTSLEHALAHFFRGVETCTRMVKCAQTLSFGLRLSAPMPPVARMETHLPGVDEDCTGRAGLALRDLRALLMDVLEGGIQLAGACRMMQCSMLQEPGDDCSDPAEGERWVRTSGVNQNPHLLACVLKAEEQLAATLRRFIAELANKINQAMVVPEDWGIWWESRLVDASDAVGNMVEYFEAASPR